MASLRVLTPRQEIRSTYVASVRHLSTRLLDRWEELHAAEDGCLGPFLHPAYARAAADVRDDIEVAVLERDGEPAVFLPFQRMLPGMGGPVGGRLCDLAGAVARPDAVWNPEELVRVAGLKALRLPNVPARISAFADGARPEDGAPVLDLRGGFEAYRRASLDSGSSYFRQVERKARKLEREVGPWRFEWQTGERDRVFETLLRWKEAQRRQTRTPNVLQLAWARALVERLRHTRTPGFEGVLSALWVGDTLAAAHFGLATSRVLHYWIPAYNVDLASYSPGLLALVELARAAAARGIGRIDLGCGEERYKQRAATGTIDMTVAMVHTSPAYRVASQAYEHVRTWSRASRWGGALRGAGRVLRRGTYRIQATFTPPASG